MDTQHIRAFFDELNRDYLAVHRRKEDLFWATYMATSDDHEGFAAAERAYKAFVSDPSRLSTLRGYIVVLENLERNTPRESWKASTAAGLLFGLRGWRSLFEANVVEGSGCRAALDKIITLEAELFAKRREHKLRHIGESGKAEEATLGALLMNQSTNPSETARESSLRALRDLEVWVLQNGFLEIVKARNAFAREKGFRDFFDFKVHSSEAMSPEALFEILDEFERSTREVNASGLGRLASTFGPETLKPWNIRYRMSGDVIRELDPYFPFDRALETWTRSFRRLGIAYRGATLQLDLLEREGKYQNGFCHAPVPAFFDDGTWVPARINFTSEGRPEQPGAGQRALETLFHEGGHAAHFANVLMNAPCFSQEFAPTSMAYAETQSMFCESLLSDADWLSRYARKADGEAMPAGLIRQKIERSQPFLAYANRMILLVPYFERALYALSDAELAPERILEMARQAERKVLGAESARPILAIPHLLNQESAAGYHGYLLATMAVEQTRSWLLDRYGYIADNPEVGRLLAEKYWAHGNSQTQDQTLRALTGEGFSPRYLAEACNASVKEAWEVACDSMASSKERDYPEDFPMNLDADIRIVHGASCFADNAVSEERMCADFAEWVGWRYPRR